jgi:hypothetical protein
MGKAKKIEIKLAKSYKATVANENKLKNYIDERHTGNSKETSHRPNTLR